MEAEVKVVIPTGEGGASQWHARAALSAADMKFGSQWITKLRSQGYDVWEAHLDAMSKLPYYISAKQGAMQETAHSFPLTESCLLCTSAVSHCPPVEDTRPRQGTKKPQLPQGRPRQLDLYVRPYRYFTEDALEHGEDLFQSANATPRMKNADAVFLGSDNGPGYSLREMIVLHLNWRLARQNLWAHIVRGSQAPDHSTWHWQSEQPFSVVRRAVVGHLFGRSWCNGDPVDQPLPMKEIIEKTTEAATKEYVQLLRNVADQEELCVSCTYHCTLCTKCCSCDISQIVISNVGFARTSRGMSSPGTPQTRYVSSPTVLTLRIITNAPPYNKCGNHGSHDCVKNLWTWASTSLLSGFHVWSAIGAWTRRRRAWSAKPVWPPNAGKNLTSL